jgi:hypothetical protein
LFIKNNATAIAKDLGKITLPKVSNVLSKIWNSAYSILNDITERTLGEETVINIVEHVEHDVNRQHTGVARARLISAITERIGKKTIKPDFDLSVCVPEDISILSDRVREMLMARSKERSVDCMFR